MEATTLESIVKSTTSTPIFFDDDDEEFLPSENQPKSDSAPQIISDPPPEAADAPAELPQSIAAEDPTPCRSSCMAKKPETQGPLQLERAIQESTQAENWLKTTHVEQKKTLQDLEEEEARNKPKIVKDKAIKELCQAFRTLNLRDEKAEQID
jgi:hypothetical protein